MLFLPSTTSSCWWSEFRCGSWTHEDRLFHTARQKFKVEFQGDFQKTPQYVLDITATVQHDFRITYCPRAVGVYSIHVLDKDQNVAGKPIKVDVFDPNMIKLSKVMTAHHISI